MGNDKQLIRNFKTLWIQYDLKNTDKHQLFFKEHSIRNQEPQYPKGRTLFVLNVPPYTTSESLKRAFDELCGTVESVTFTTPTGFKTGYVVFQKDSAIDRALSLSKDTVIILHEDNTTERITGVKKWCREYNVSLCNEKRLKKEVEEYMNSYDEQIATHLEKEKMDKEREEEESGWVTVTGHKKRGQFALSRKESTINKVREKEEQRKKKKQLLNFYTFQIRESKKQNLAELRKKFEMDKKKLQELKIKRTFKPF